MFQLQKNIIASGLVLSLALGLSACGGGEGRQAEYLARAEQSLEEGNIKKARVDIKNALQINANSAEARYLMALVEEHEKNWRGVYGNLRAAIDINPKHLEANIKLGQLFVLSNNVDKAIEHANTAYELAPGNADVLALKSWVAQKQGDDTLATNYAREALAINAAQPSAVALMVNKYLKSEPEKALAYTEAGINADPNNLTIQMLQIQAYEANGRTNDAVAEYQRLIANYPDELSYVITLSRYLATKERTDEAEDVLRTATHTRSESTDIKLALVQFLVQIRGNEVAVAELVTMLDKDPENFKLRHALGSIYAANDQQDLAKALYLEVLDYDVNSAEALTARNVLAELDLKNGDAEAAQAWLDEVLKIDSENPGALTLRAKIKLANNDYKGAIPDLRVVLRSNPESIPALLMLANAQEKDRTVSLALDNYQKVLAINPENIIALYQSGRLLAGQQEYDRAVVNLEKVLEKEPENIKVINQLSGVYAQMERWDEAEALAHRLTQKESTRSIAKLMESRLALRQGKYDEAISLAKSALNENEELVDAVTVIAQAYAAQDNVDGAIEYVLAYLEDHPDNGQVYALLSRLYLAKKEVDKAETSLLSAIEIEPSQISSYISLARLYRHQNKSEKIEPLYVGAIASNPSSTILIGELAVLHQLNGDYDKALAELEKAHALDEKSLIITNNLAALLIDHFPSDKNLRRAQQLTFDFEASKHPALLDTLGWLQYKMDNVPQAISLLKAAQERGGRGADYYYHLGMAFHKNGQTELAREQLSMAVAEGEFSGREEAEKVLNSL